MNTVSDSFYVKFWGVRGTIPTPQPAMMKYGGNTSCVEVRCGSLVFALDAGTGIVAMSRQEFTHLHLLLSHTHIDHIMGLCVMPKIFQEGFSVDIWAGHLFPDMLINEALAQFISPPLFPVPIEKMPAKLYYHDFMAGNELRHQDFIDRDIVIYTMPLHHPDRATAYRIVYQGKSVTYVTDVEHRNQELDKSLISFIRNSDVFIYDSTYDDQQFEEYIGWGHSTWQHALRLGEAANVGKVVMFHHDPHATDEILDNRAAEIARSYTQLAIIAKEGLVLTL